VSEPVTTGPAALLDEAPPGRRRDRHAEALLVARGTHELRPHRLAAPSTGRNKRPLAMS
jgi:hypothetical protein